MGLQRHYFAHRTLLTSPGPSDKELLPIHTALRRSATNTNNNLYLPGIPRNLKTTTRERRISEEGMGEVKDGEGKSQTLEQAAAEALRTTNKRWIVLLPQTSSVSAATCEPVYCNDGSSPARLPIASGT
ncbi:hypothetical protein MIND_00907300 [Mycena indigotica]|uniref:Uncharacterized protein n=1 Tax=Mycena indigotica TaxID=2126181 RepID=A0A8H6SC07_9AGAR|nr:uncharacterized protein MIND_00907300 [Mycena indigotica]KAF7296766.1 hypothetical protein MIND_00907300 [Mycena indigotica]